MTPGAYRRYVNQPLNSCSIVIDQSRKDCLGSKGGMSTKSTLYNTYHGSMRHRTCFIVRVNANTVFSLVACKRDDATESTALCSFLSRTGNGLLLELKS